VSPSTCHPRVLVDNIYRYDPGDVAVIHPHAPADEVDTLLNLQDWGDTADDSFNIERNMSGMGDTLSSQKAFDIS
jgi:sulfite reductase alpha subunit-like flavoprotein